MDDHISKSIDPRKLASLVNRWNGKGENRSGESGEPRIQERGLGRPRSKAVLRAKSNREPPSIFARPLPVLLETGDLEKNISVFCFQSAGSNRDNGSRPGAASCGERDEASAKPQGFGRGSGRSEDNLSSPESSADGQRQYSGEVGTGTTVTGG
jgi:hypothetical protein